MNASTHALTKTFFALLLAAPAMGCAAGSNDDARAPSARLEIVVGTSTVDVLGAKAESAPFRPTPPPIESPLHWELRDGATIVASGTTTDPRVVRSENGSGGMHGAAVARIVVPNVAGDLVLYDDGGDGWRRIGETHFTPIAAGVTAVGRMAEDFDPSKVATATPLGTPKPGAKLRILIVSEGYRSDELAQFHVDAMNVANGLLGWSAYRDHADQIGFWTADVPSNVSLSGGIPTYGHSLDTAFQVAFAKEGGDTDRCPPIGGGVSTIASSVFAHLETVKEKIGATNTVVLVNNASHAGCGGDPAVVTAAPDSTFLVAHELGHSIFHLADEYDYDHAAATCPATGWTDAENSTADPIHPPWSCLIAAGTPLPTPDAGDETVGAFEGSGYCKNGVYRPQHTCTMQAVYPDFCAACRAVIDHFFAGQPSKACLASSSSGSGTPSGGSGTPASTSGTVLTITNSTGSGAYVRCTGAPSTSCSDWTWIDAGKSVNLPVVGMELYLDNSVDVPAPSVVFSWKKIYPTSTSFSVYADAADPLTPPTSAGGGGGASGTPAGGSSCGFTCAKYGYTAGQCYLGWYCDGTCVSYTGCSEASAGGGASTTKHANWESCSVDDDCQSGRCGCNYDPGPPKCLPDATYPKECS